MSNDNKFYVFLDIDGTLWDFDHLPFSELCLFTDEDADIRPNMYNDYATLNSDSVDALNYLLNELNQNYDVELVITSNKRKDIDIVKEYLFGEFQKKYFGNYNCDFISSKLDFNPEKIFSTEINKKKRGAQIIDYLINKGIEKKNLPLIYTVLNKSSVTKNGKTFNNYVVIDDEIAPLKFYIPKNKIIKTSKFHKSLAMEQVVNFLKNNNLNICEEKEK